MSDVGGSLLCIWHCAVDNISINCGYAKGMRRSLIRGYSFLQLKRQYSYGADVDKCGRVWKRATPACGTTEGLMFAWSRHASNADGNPSGVRRVAAGVRG